MDRVEGSSEVDPLGLRSASEDAAAQLSSRLSRGASAVLLGKPSLDGWRLDLPLARLDSSRARDPLELARALLFTVGQVLGVDPMRWSMQSAGLQGRILDQEPERHWGQSLVLALQSLRRSGPPRAALVFERVDAADPAVLALIAQIVEWSGRLEVPVLITTAAPDPSGKVHDWIESLAKSWGTEALFRVAAPAPKFTPKFERESAASPPSAPGAMPEQVRRVLRVLSLSTPSTQIDNLARALGQEPVDVLESLQHALDLGWPIIDMGGGQVALHPEAVEVVRREIMPSLAEFYAQRLAELDRAAPLRDRREGSPARSARPESTLVTEPGAVLGAATPELGARDSATPDGDAQVEPKVEPRERPGSAGQGPYVERWIDAVEEAAAMGLFHEAVNAGGELLAQLDRAPRTQENRLQHIRLWIALARAHHLGAGTLSAGGTPELGLSHARALVELAQEALEPSDPEVLAGAADTLHAEILYEIGTPQDLQTALLAIMRAIQRYQEAGEPLLAARGLNDQAAIYVRLGDLEQAHELLERSRETFEQVSSLSVEAREHLAQTEHLLARLVLHAEPDTACDAEVLGVAMNHAHTAESLYAELDRPRELARVHETIGRLELRIGHESRAQAALGRAARAQQDHGDVLGLARTAAGMSELASLVGRPAEALDLLSRSIQLNGLVGSRSGLRYNREALETLARDLGPEAKAPCQSLAEEIERAELRLAQRRTANGDPESRPD